FRLVNPYGQIPPSRDVSSTPLQEPVRKATTIQRIVRNTDVASQVKEWHDYHCQICGDRLMTRVGPYAESAHIRPLGSPHNGPDSSDNILCLCPNHHVLFDYGAFLISNDLNLIGIGRAERLRTVKEHRLSSDHLAYHRGMYPPEQGGE